MRTLRADQRAAIFSAAVLLHAALIVAWLAARPPVWPIAADPPPMLARFDPLPIMPPAIVPPEPTAADAQAGGSSAAPAPRRAITPAMPPAASVAIRPLVRVPAPPVALAAPVAARGIAAAEPAGDAADGDEGTGRGGGYGEGLGTGNGEGAGAGGGTLRYANAEWVRQPTPREWKLYWPRGSDARKLAGSTVLGCAVTRSGRTVRCRILGETPAGRGIGAAAIAMSHVFRVRAPSANGKALDMPVRIPIAFDVTAIPDRPTDR